MYLESNQKQSNILRDTFQHYRVFIVLYTLYLGYLPKFAFIACLNLCGIYHVLTEKDMSMNIFDFKRAETH